MTTQIEYPTCGLLPEMEESDVGNGLILDSTHQCLVHQAPVSTTIVGWVSRKPEPNYKHKMVVVIFGLVQGLKVDETITVGSNVWLDSDLGKLTTSTQSSNPIGVVTAVDWIFRPIRGCGGKVEDYAQNFSKSWTYWFDSGCTDTDCTLYARHRIGWGGYKVESGHKRAVVNDTSNPVLVYQDAAKTDLLHTLQPGERAAWVWNGSQWADYQTVFRVADVMLL